MFSLRRGPEYLYRLFDVLLKQTREVKTLYLQVGFQRGFHDKQEAKFTKSLTRFVWSEMTLGMSLSDGG